MTLLKLSLLTLCIIFLQVSCERTEECDDPYCYECYSSTQCQECDYGYLLDDKNQCVNQICVETYCLECTRHGDCEKCEYPYYTLDGRCELSCPSFYKEEYPRKCVPEYARNVGKLTETFEIMMWCMMFLICGLFLFCAGKSSCNKLSDSS